MLLIGPHKLLPEGALLGLMSAVGLGPSPPTQGRPQSYEDFLAVNREDQSSFYFFLFFVLLDDTRTNTQRKVWPTRPAPP